MIARMFEDNISGWLSARMLHQAYFITIRRSKVESVSPRRKLYTPSLYRLGGTLCRKIHKRPTLIPLAGL